MCVCFTLLRETVAFFNRSSSSLIVRRINANTVFVFKRRRLAYLFRIFSARYSARVKDTAKAKSPRFGNDERNEHVE